MRYRFLSLIALACSASTAFAVARPAGSLEGIYRVPHPIVTPGLPSAAPDALDETPTIEVEDRFTIRKDTGGSIQFAADLVFSYYHTCQLEGEALLLTRGSTNGSQRFRYLQPKAEVTTKPCTLDIAVNDKEIRLLDPTNSCEDFCGARGVMHNARFPLASKQPLNPPKIRRRRY